MSGSGDLTPRFARGLLAHDASGFREWRASASLAFDPDPSSERGLALSLSRLFGAASSGGADALFSRATMAGLDANGGGDPAGRFDAKASCGLPIGGRHEHHP